MGWNDFSLAGCGEWFDNEDGSSRQVELARCRPGEMAELVREPDNPHDARAVAIVSCRGVRVGYLRRERAVWIGSKIDRGYDVRAIVERVRGADMERSALGILLRINMDGEEPELPHSHRARARAAPQQLPTNRVLGALVGSSSRFHSLKVAESGQ